MRGAYVMRLTTLLIFLLLPLVPAVAASQCGPRPDLDNKFLERLVKSGAAGLARSRARGKVLANAVARDVTRFKRAYPKLDSAAVGAYYFYEVCRAITENRPSGQTLKQYDLHKLKIVAEAFGTPPSMNSVLNSLKSKFKEASKARAKSKKARRREAAAPNGQEAEREVAAAKPKKSLRMEHVPPSPQPPKKSAKPKPAPKNGAARPFAVQPGLEAPRTAIQPESMGAAPRKAPETETGRAAPMATTREFKFEAAEQPAADKKDEGCAELGIIGGDCTDFESVIRNLKEVPLAYNHPKSMYLGKRTQISLVLKTNKEDHKKELEGLQGEVKEGETKISRVMQAELTGEAFKIEPRGPQQRTITTLAPVKWTWFATPLEEGDNKNLTMELSAIIREGTRDLPPVAIRTFRTNIKVDVRWWDLMIHKVKAFDPIYQLATAIGGVVTFIVFVWRIGVWMRRRDRADEAI